MLSFARKPGLNFVAHEALWFKGIGREREELKKHLAATGTTS
jgi:hypothetical protein